MVIQVNVTVLMGWNTDANGPDFGIRSLLDAMVQDYRDVVEFNILYGGWDTVSDQFFLPFYDKYFWFDPVPRFWWGQFRNWLPSLRWEAPPKFAYRDGDFPNQRGFINIGMCHSYGGARSQRTLWQRSKKKYFSGIGQSIVYTQTGEPELTGEPFRMREDVLNIPLGPGKPGNPTSHCGVPSLPSVQASVKNVISTLLPPIDVRLV